MVEFLLMIPLFLGLTWYLLQVNMAINKSIVGQKHARSQLFLKMLNHRDGPEAVDYDLHPSRRAVFWMGVAEEPTSGEVGGSTSSAPTVQLGVGLNSADRKPYPGNQDEPGEPDRNDLRQRVRIRTAVGLCTSRKRSADGSQLSPFCAERP